MKLSKLATERMRGGNGSCTSGVASKFIQMATTVKMKIMATMIMKATVIATKCDRFPASILASTTFDSQP